MSSNPTIMFRQVAFLAAVSAGCVMAATPPPATQERMVEWTVTTQKTYADPFNDVDVDVIFTRDSHSWRVPAFWRGQNRWTVRFAPPTPGKYTYHLASTDRHNPDLNGRAGHVTITPYAGDNPLLKHGMVRVSANHRYFEHADGKPFYWLGDTWWMGLSDRLPWSGFQQLTADRKAKGFTVVQIVAGLVPFEEVCPEDPGCRNEGGAVWEPGFTRINPGYFDAADRRIQLLVDSGIVPEIEGTYASVLAQMGVAKMKKHWRYVIARYGAYPVLWNLADEAVDPPAAIASRFPTSMQWLLPPSPGDWTEIARYIRSTDPSHHPLTVNEWVQPGDIPLQDATLTDFDQLQPGHWGWPSLGNEVMQLNQRFARTDLIKPVVVGEIGYEMLGGTHLEDFQRMAFWLATLNGAAGYTYGAAPTYEANNPEKPLHRSDQYTFLTWEEGMNLPGSYQVGLSAKLLRQYPWWQFTPHPEWVTPRGTTLLEPHSGHEFDVGNFDFGLIVNEDFTPTEEFLQTPEILVPGGKWKAHRGSFHGPYAAGVPGEIRVIYTPAFGLAAPPPPTVLGLEQGVRYQAYYWDPMLGIKFDLGAVEVPVPGAVELRENFEGADSHDWSEYGSTRAHRQGGKFTAAGETLSVRDTIKMQNCVVAVDARSDASAGLLLRYQDADDYVAAVFSAKKKILYLMTRINGVNSGQLGAIPVAKLGMKVHLSAEVRVNWGAASITDGQQTYSTQIVDISGRSSNPLLPVDVRQLKSGAVGLWHQEDDQVQQFYHFEVRQSPVIAPEENLNRNLVDARGTHRGELSGPGWDDWGRNKALLLNAYRPERFPTNQDWVLVLDARQ